MCWNKEAKAKGQKYIEEQYQELSPCALATWLRQLALVTDSRW